MNERRVVSDPLPQPLDMPERVESLPPPLSAGRRLFGRRATVRRRGRFASSPLVERIAVILAVLIVIVAVIGPWIAPHNPSAVNLPDQLKAPGSGHWFGTDVNGRDVLSRVLTGARVTLSATAIVLAVATIVGVLIGTLCRTRQHDRRRSSNANLRHWTGPTRPRARFGSSGRARPLPAIRRDRDGGDVGGLGIRAAVRTVVREIRDAEFVDSARMLGVSRNSAGLPARPAKFAIDPLGAGEPRRRRGHVDDLGTVIHLGVGAQIPSAEWGAVIAAAADNVVNGWWALLFPGLAIAFTAVVFNLVGDWLRVQTDPMLREQ